MPYVPFELKKDSFRPESRDRNEIGYEIGYEMGGRRSNSNRKFQISSDSILLIRREIGQDSVSRYWQQIQQLICLRLQWCRRRHLLKRGAGLIRFQAVGHTRAAG